jgi:hypothetical protein
MGQDEALTADWLRANCDGVKDGWFLFDLTTVSVLVSGGEPVNRSVRLVQNESTVYLGTMVDVAQLTLLIEAITQLKWPCQAEWGRGHTLYRCAKRLSP